MRTLLLILSAALLFACGADSSGTTTGNPEGMDLSAYTIEKISGSDLNYVYRMDDDEHKAEEGFVRKGQKTGMWIQYHPQSHLPATIQHFENGVPTGAKILLDQRGQVNEVVGMKDGRPHGISAVYKYGKPMQIAPYKNGKLDGTFKKYFDGRDRGKLQQSISYSDGKLDGKYIHYDNEGQKILEYTYDKGEKISGGMIKNNK